MGLFSQIEGDPPPSTDVETLASRLVGIDFGQLAQVTKPAISPKRPAASKPQTLVLNLFDDVVFTGIVEHVEPTASGHALWGRLDGVELGTMTLVVNGSVVVGTVRTPDAVYTIRTAGGDTYIIRQIDESTLPPLGEPLEDPLVPRDASIEEDDVPLDDGSVIDVMVVYTPEARIIEGGRAAIEAVIDLFVTETNQVFENSSVIHRIRLVLREEIEYVETTNSLIDLGRLSINSDGHMDQVHELRDLYAADFVHLLVARSDVAGRAELSGVFGLTKSHLGAGLVFAHEFGHNLGLRHDRYTVGVPATGSNYGYVNQRAFEPGAPDSARWVTLMAYTTQCFEVGGFVCRGVPYFSNPELTYNGDPMGVPADHPSTGADGPADAVKTLNERRETNANRRRSLASPTPRVHLTLSPYWLSENGGMSTVRATLHRPSSVDTVVTVSASSIEAVTLSRERTITIRAGETVSPDAVTITGIDNRDRTGDVRAEVSATAANASSQGVIGPEPLALAISDDETTPTVTLSLSRAEILEKGILDDDPNTTFMNAPYRTFLTATLDNRSNNPTLLTLATSPAQAVEMVWRGPFGLTIQAGQTVSSRVSITSVDNDERTGDVVVTVSATSSQGVTGPESATLTIIDDEGPPRFVEDSISYTFTSGVGASRALPEPVAGSGLLTYSISPPPGNGVTFTPGPPARLGVSATSLAASETSYTLTAKDNEGNTDTMVVNITVRDPVCANSVAVSEYVGSAIVADCEVLLSSRDTLQGDQSLNWSQDHSIEEWSGVSINEGRVWRLQLPRKSLTGTIPSELGTLSSLRKLSLSSNQLTGEIPPELDSLASLEFLSLASNRLTGEIPSELGNLANLELLFLSSNRLIGEIPSELGNLANLEIVFLASNQLTGCIPASLRSTRNNDLDKLGLPFCDVLLSELIISPRSLTPEFDPYQTTYTALEGTSSVTVTAVNEHNAVIRFFDEGDMEIPDGDASLDGLQIDLDGGINAINVRVTSEDGMASHTYTIWLVSASSCLHGGAVSDPANSGLVADCDALLMARDKLAGSASLNWSADSVIS